MAFTLIASVQAGGIANGVVSGAIDTTGATLITLHACFYTVGTSDIAAFVSDSKLNSYTGLTPANGSVTSSQICYVENPTVGAAHTFTISGVSSVFPSIQVMAWSGNAASPFDQDNGDFASSTATLQTGSVTPSEANELLVTGVCFEDNSGATPTIDSGFTASLYTPYAGGDHFGGSMAYLLQGAASAVNPEWDVINSVSELAAVIATFKGTGGGGGTTWPGYISPFGWQ